MNVTSCTAQYLETWRKWCECSNLPNVNGKWKALKKIPFSFLMLCLCQGAGACLKPARLLPYYILQTLWYCSHLSGRESACNAGDAGDAGSIPGLGRSPGGGHGNPLQDSCLGNPRGQRSLAGYIQSMGSLRVGHSLKRLSTQYTSSNNKFCS